MNTVFNRRTVLMAAALGASTTLLQACGGSDDEPQRNIVELAQNTPDLSILVEAVTAAGLASTLSTGTLTVNRTCSLSDPMNPPADSVRLYGTR